MFKKIITFALAHKIITAIVAGVIFIGGYQAYHKIYGTVSPTRYALAIVQKGTIISYITGTGQVSVSSQVDLKPKVSADVVYVGVRDGTSVGAGTLIVQLDSSDAEKGVRDAQSNLDSANLSLQKLLQPPDELSILQAENALAQAKEVKQNAQTDLRKAYDNGFNTVANAFLDLSPSMTGLQDILFGTTLSAAQSNLAYYIDAVKNYDAKAIDYKNEASDAYAKARQKYDTNFQDYKLLTRFSDDSAIDGLISETYDTARSVAESLKTSNTLIQFYEDKLTEHSIKPGALADMHLSQLNTLTGKVNTQILNLLSIKNQIDADRSAITDADRAITEKTASLDKLKSGADSLDIQSQQLAVRQRQNALLDAKDKFADYFIRASFDSIVAKINVKKGDSASAATVIATVITTEQVAEISMNEVDVAKVKTGEKAALTFDAIPNLSITGKVAEIDTIGTMSQGVVSYMVKIGFDTQDNRVKPGMTVSASIITDTKTDALYIPNSAVKSQNGANYVEVSDSADVPASMSMSANFVILSKPTTRQIIEIGIANDEVTEIISGLKEGDVVVGRTITTAPPTQNNQSSSLRIPGLTGNGGGGFRGGGGGRGN